MSTVNDYFPNTLKPRHLDFQTVGNSSQSAVLDSLVSTEKAYTDFEDLGTGPDHSAFKSSGYQYTVFITGEAFLTEYLLVSDSSVVGASTSEIVEYVVVLDTESSVEVVFNPSTAYDYFIQETQPIYTNFSAQSSSPAHTAFKSIIGGDKGYVLDPLDASAGHVAFKSSGWTYYLDPTPTVSTTLTEYLLVFDEAESESPGQTTLTEYFLVDDSEIVDVETAPLSEYFLLLDSASGLVGPTPVEFNGTLVLHVIATVQPNFTLVNHVQAALEANFTLNLGVLANDLVGVTNATGASNVLTPTFVNNGTIIYSNPATVPAIIPSAGCKVYLPCTNLVDTLGVDDLTGWDLNLQDAGGSWTVKSMTSLPIRGTEIQLFGLTGTITSNGFEWSNNSGNYKSQGIFGLRSMNREAFFLTYGRPEYAYNLVNKYADYPESQFYKTHKDAAHMIGALAGASIQWQIPDFPLPNFQFQGGQTGLSAVQSLASDCGGTIRWAGGNTYKAMFPDVPLGIFTIPDCCLILSVNQECFLDLNSGYYNPGVHVLPQLGIFNSTQQNLILTGDGQPTISNPLIAGNRYTGQVENRFTSRQVLTDTSPVVPFDLPLDTENIFIRVITNNVVSGNKNYILPQSEALTSPNGNWIYLESPNTNHSQYTYVDGNVKLQFKVTPDLFPTGNSDVDNGDFSLQIGITRRQPPYQNNAVGSSLLAAQTILKYRFVPACTGSITCNFFGAIPMPGMRLVANFNNTELTGIIESVSFSGPNTLTINYVQWFRFEFYQQLSQSGNV